MGRINKRRLGIIIAFVVIFDVVMTWASAQGLPDDAYSSMIYFGFLFQIGTFSAWDIFNRKNLATPVLFGASLAFITCMTAIPLVSRRELGMSIGLILALGASTIFKLIFFYYGFVRQTVASAPVSSTTPSHVHTHQ